VLLCLKEGKKIEILKAKDKLLHIILQSQYLTRYTTQLTLQVFTCNSIRRSTTNSSSRMSKNSSNMRKMTSASSSNEQDDKAVEEFLKNKTPFRRHGLKQMDIMHDKETLGNVSQIIACTNSGKSTGLILWAVRRWFFVLEKCKKEGIPPPSATHYFILTVPTRDSARMMFEFMTKVLKKLRS
jgi:hypothetical protein